MIVVNLAFPPSFPPCSLSVGLRRGIIQGVGGGGVWWVGRVLFLHSSYNPTYLKSSPLFYNYLLGTKLSLDVFYSSSLNFLSSNECKWAKDLHLNDNLFPVSAKPRGWEWRMTLGQLPFPPSIHMGWAGGVAGWVLPCPPSLPTRGRGWRTR